MAEARETSAGEDAALFQPDTLLPTQFFSVLRQKGFVEGEKRLMAAVLADAVECYMKQSDAPDVRGQQMFGDAEAWIFGSTTRWLFSYGNICDVLGLDPEYVRRGLRTWRSRRAQPFTLRKAAG